MEAEIINETWDLDVLPDDINQIILSSVPCHPNQVLGLATVGEYPNIVLHQHFEEELQSAFDDEFLNNLRIVDVRHGKVLMICSMGSILAVWDPMTGNTIFNNESEDEVNSQGSVMCAASHDHKDGCQGLPIKIIWIATGTTTTKVYTFDSVTSVWQCAMAALPTLSYVEFRPGTIIGDAIYWVLKFKHIFG